MVERRKTAIIIADTDSDLLEVLSDFGVNPAAILSELLVERPPADLLGFVGEVRTQLRRLSHDLTQLRELDFNKVDGDVKARLGKFHFPLRKTLYFALVNAVKLSGVVIATMANPVAGGIAATALFLDSAGKAAELISRFTPDELLVFETLSAAIVNKREKDRNIVSATAQEVETVFNDRKQAHPPEGISTILQQLATTNKGVKVYKLEPEMEYAVVN